MHFTRSWRPVVARGTALATISAMTLTVIAGSANAPLATSISEELGVCERVLQRFADGELHVEIEESVREITSWSFCFLPTPAVVPAPPA